MLPTDRQCPVPPPGCNYYSLLLEKYLGSSATSRETEPSDTRPKTLPRHSCCSTSMSLQLKVGSKAFRAKQITINKQIDIESSPHRELKIARKPGIFNLQMLGKRPLVQGHHPVMPTQPLFSAPSLQHTRYF